MTAAMTSPFKSADGWNPYEMHARLLPQVHSETEWLVQRRGGIGASEAAAAIGMGTYEGETAYSVWLDKTGRVPLSTAQTEQMELGHILEPAIRDTAARRLGYDVRTMGSLVSREHDWFRASLDAVLLTPDDGPIPLEVKNTSQYLAEQWADDQVPDRAELQVQHQLGVTGAPYGYVAGMIGGSRIVTRRVDRDPQLIEFLMAEEAALWQHVLDDTPPPVVWRDSVETILGAAGTTDVDEYVLEPDEALQAAWWIAKYQESAAAAKDADKAKREARNNLVALSHGHPQVIQRVGGEESVLYRLQRGTFAAKRFQEAEPDLAPLFMHKIETVDTKALRNEDPALFRKYQSVSIRLAES